MLSFQRDLSNDLKRFRKKRCALVHSSISFALTHVKIDSINKRLVLKF
ncbi:hypothetical protein [Leptospira noguchii]|nr:hypothetical protein [Leptospira noguchii]UOG51516.1 hypothetical protein MAL09_12505 [Leptospira noguchii]